MIIPEAFHTKIKALYEYFNIKTPPADATIDHWHKELNSLSETALDKALGLLRRNDSIPRNLPKAIKTAWSGYLNANMASMENDIPGQSKAVCPDCNSSELIQIVVFDKYYNRSKPYVCHCSKCSGKEKSGPRDKRCNTLAGLGMMNIPCAPFASIAGMELKESCRKGVLNGV